MSRRHPEWDKTCNTPGCDSALRYDNTTGYCKKNPDCKKAAGRARRHRLDQQGTRRIWEASNPATRATMQRKAGIKHCHGMTPEEYDEYLSHGCAITGCQKDAKGIDHDHFVGCPESNHSCDECRRGPLCGYHNSYVIRFIDHLRAGKLDNELRYLGYSVMFCKLTADTHLIPGVVLEFSEDNAT